MKRLPLVCLGALALLSACGDAASPSTASVATVGPTNWVTQPQTASTTTSSTIAGQSGSVGQITTAITEYEIKAGDVPFTVAQRFKISLDALELANVDTAGYSAFYPSLMIKIPVGATIPPPSATTTTVAGVTPVATTTTLAGGGSGCAPGSYVIQAGDLPSRVAQKFDVTLEQLDAANVNTQGYKSFIVGVTIVIPAKTGC